jgi:hypothetical protein
VPSIQRGRRRAVTLRGATEIVPPLHKPPCGLPFIAASRSSRPPSDRRPGAPNRWGSRNRSALKLKRVAHFGAPRSNPRTTASAGDVRIDAARDSPSRSARPSDSPGRARRRAHRPTHLGRGSPWAHARALVTRISTDDTGWAAAKRTTRVNETVCKAARLSHRAAASSKRLPSHQAKQTSIARANPTRPENALAAEPVDDFETRFLGI